MLLVAFKWFVRWAAGSAFLLLLGGVITAFVQSYADALDLAKQWIFSFDGIVVGAVGYGVVFFLRDERGRLRRAVERILDVPAPLRGGLSLRLDRIESWWLTPLVAVAFTAIGGYIAYGAGIPLSGFAHWYLTAAVFSFYFVGAYGLVVMIAIMDAFYYVESNAAPGSSPRISLKAPFRAQELQAVDLFFIVSSAMCILAVYVCFRGTLTAFAGAPSLFYRALIIPVFFFLPASLVYSFYPRHVLRQVWETDTFLAVDKFVNESACDQPQDIKSGLELRKLILDVKEKMIADRRALPLLSLRDVPALTITALTLLQLVTQADPVITHFFTGK